VKHHVVGTPAKREKNTQVTIRKTTLILVFSSASQQIVNIFPTVIGKLFFPTFF
jgi:hypothetical protein